MKKLDLLQGTLDLLILKTLEPGPMHGFAVAHLWMFDAVPPRGRLPAR